MSVNEYAERTFDYKVGWLSILLLFAIGLSLGTFMVYQAQASTEGLVINGVAKLSGEQAKLFFMAIAVVMFGLVFLAISGLAQRFKGSNRIRLRDDGVFMPGPPWSGEDKFHRFASVESTKVMGLHKARVLQVKTRSSRFAIASQSMASGQAFDELVALVQKGIKSARQPD